MKFRVGDKVEIKPGTPGYQLWYKDKQGIIVGVGENDEGELRYKVDMGAEKYSGLKEILPFAEWELRRM